jgi:chemotaxis protein methyltransferase CheR
MDVNSISRDLAIPAALISERMGLHFPEDRWPDLAKGLDRAGAALGYDTVHSFIRSLLSDSFGQREIQALATHLTIGETHFFRSPETYTMLQTQLMPELIAHAQKTTRRLRLWSAGCAGGQEPYSLAILMTRLIPDPSNWDITILATDINPDAFAIAKTAEYTQWSFRGTPSWVMNGYFTRTAEGGYRLSPAIRDMVTFRYLNLVEDLYPSLAMGMSDFDLILCRNVLMYFSRATMKQVADKLQRSVRPGGYLLTTPSEASRDLMHSLTPILTGGEILYKKETISSSHHADASANSVPRQPAKTAGQRPTSIGQSDAATHRAATQPPQRRAEVQRPATATQQQPRRARVSRTHTGRRLVNRESAAREARALADKGRLEEALALCEAAVRNDKLNASLYYLKATILQALGRDEAAEQALQSTLFLDDEFVLARVMLGAIARGQSRSTEAAKHFRFALALLKQMPSDMVLTESEGLTAGEMAETVESLIGSECAS